MAVDSRCCVLDFPAIIHATNLHQGTSYYHLKDKQKEVLSGSAVGDVVGVLPTGFGKTVVIQMLPFIIQGETGSVVLSTPLNAIIEEQSKRFGASCVVVDDQLLQDLEANVRDAATERVRNGQFQFLLGHPEKLTHPALRRTLMTPAVSSKITHIVVDEVHCVLSWGKSDFRPAFLDLCHLRASLPQAKMVALTATATSEAITEIIKELHMRLPAVIKASPDRPSVYIEVRRRPANSGGGNTVVDSYMACLEPLLTELQEKEDTFPRTIVYMPLKWCGYGHEQALDFLEDCSTFQPMHHEDDEQVKSFVAQYHAPQTPEMKTLITKTMLCPDSPLRLLLATEAYGMGADSPNVRRVVHVGPPSNLESYIQEIGRCGRDGQAAEAILYFNNSDLGANKHHLTDSMRQFCRLKTCRRKFLMEYFGCPLESSESSKCCDVCSGTPPAEPEPPKHLTPHPVISFSLRHYFEAENCEETENCMPSLSTGLCDELADILASEPEKYQQGNNLAKEFPFLLQNYIENIQSILTTRLSQIRALAGPET